MNPRERILAAIEHREPDRVPLDLGATPSSGISARRLEVFTPGGEFVFDTVHDILPDVPPANVVAM